MVHSTRLVQSNWGFALLNFAIWYWNTFLNKCGFVIHHFNAHFSLYFVFANFLIIICCLLYLYFRLGKGHWTKSKFEWFSYSGSKWVVKQQRQLTTSTVPLAQELLMNIQCSGGSITCKGDKSLEDEEHSSGGWLEVDNNQLRVSSKLIPLQLHKNLPKNSISTILWSFSIWSKLERWKSSISGCLMSWLQIKKIVYTTTMNHFSIRSWCAMKSGFYTATGYEQLSGWTKKKLQTTSQSQTYTQKRVMVTLCWSAASLIHYSFLNPGETIISEAYAQQIDGKWEWKC